MKAFARMDIEPCGTCFLTKPHMIGATLDEMSEKVVLTQERLEELAFLMKIAADELRIIAPEGRC